MRTFVTRTLGVFLITAVFLFPHAVFAQLTDNFDSYTAGSLNGQGSWSGSTNYQVETSVNCSSSPNGVSDVTQNATISKSFTLHSTGTQRYYGRLSSVVVNVWTVKLTDAGVNVTDTRSNTGVIEYFAGGGFNTLGSVSANTCFFVDVKWDAGTGKCQYALNGGSFTSADTCLGTITHGIDGVVFDDVSGPVGTVYFDTFMDGAVVTPPPNSILGLIHSFWIWN